MENIPFYINASFILTTLPTIAIFYKATQPFRNNHGGHIHLARPAKYAGAFGIL